MWVSEAHANPLIQEDLMTTDTPSVADDRVAAAYFDEMVSAVVVEELTVRDGDVVREAQRWTAGSRGQIVEDPEALAAADLTGFVTEAIRIGAHALSVTGQVQEARALEQMVKEVGEKTADSATRAVESTEQAMRDASDAVSRAAADAKRAITEADSQSRKEFVTAVSAAKQDLNSEVRRIFGGDSPELLEKLAPVLDKFGTELDRRVRTSAGELLDKAARQFDPTDPASPMAKHAAELAAQHATLTQLLDKQHTELAEKVADLTTAIRVQEAKASVSRLTTIKGGSYEEQVHRIMYDVAAGLGDEYAETGTLVGLLARCKKGDGVLTADDGAAHVVLEMTDSPRAAWQSYLDEAERNRGAAASLGLVRTVEQNADKTVRVLGKRRVVIAFDPEHDDPELLRTVVMLLRTTALASSTRTGATEIATAEERIGEAVAQLDLIDSIKKSAGLITKHAASVEKECTGLNTSIRRLLGQALDALAGCTAVDDPPVAAIAEVGGAA